MRTAQLVAAVASAVAALGCTGILPLSAAEQVAGEWAGTVACGTDASWELSWDLVAMDGGDLDGTGKLTAAREQNETAFYLHYELDVDANASGAQELDVSGTVIDCEGQDNGGEGVGCDPVTTGGELFGSAEFTWDGADTIDADIFAGELGNILWECHGDLLRD